MNPMKYVFLIGAILSGAIGMIAMLYSEAGGIWAWIPWLAFIPAFTLLNYVIEDYGLGSAYTLWAGWMIVIIAGYVVLFGESWGEVISSGQYMAIGLTILGLVGLSLSRPKKG